MTQQNITDLIQQMAAQRQSGALEAPAPALAAINRGAELERLAGSVTADDLARAPAHRKAKRAYEQGGAINTDDSFFQDDSKAGLQARLTQMQGLNAQSPSPITGGLGILNDPTDAENAAKTQRWAADDLMSKVNGAGTRTERAAYGNALGRMVSQSPGTFSPDVFADAMKSAGTRTARNEFGQAMTLAFAEGGKIDPEALLAQMSKKYSVSNTSAPAPQPQQPAPQPQAQQPQGMVQGAVGALRGRAAQIDKAAGYNRGGKIKGPGTATSDSIPAKVKQTGENILVSNGERILSAKQDQLLHRIAQERGFDSVDAMLEHGTGEPVGPTIKAGKKAAATGAQFGNEEAETSLSPLNGQATRAGNYPSKLEQMLTGAQVTPAAPNLARGDVGPSAFTKSVQADMDRYRAPEQPAPYGNEGRAVPSPITTPQQHPISVPASRAAGAPAPEPAQAPNASMLTTKDIVPGGYTDRGAGIVGSRNAAGQLNVTNVGTESVANRSSPIVDGSASALIDQKGSTYNPAAQLERMQRMRMRSDLMDPTITDPSVKQDAAKALGLDIQGAKANLENAQAGQANAITGQAQQMETMRGKLLDPNTPEAERAHLIQMLQAIGGHTQRTAPYQIHDIEEPLDPEHPMLGNRKSPRLFDPNKGTLTGFGQSEQQGGDVIAQAKAAIARGANRAAVNARLKSLGLPEVK